MSIDSVNNIDTAFMKEPQTRERCNCEPFITSEFYSYNTPLITNHLLSVINRKMSTRRNGWISCMQRRAYVRFLQVEATYVRVNNGIRFTLRAKAKRRHIRGRINFTKYHTGWEQRVRKIQSDTFCCFFFFVPFERWHNAMVNSLILEHCSLCIVASSCVLI